MDWREYQAAVSLIYREVEGIGEVQQNIYRRDIYTGSKRQVDCWISAKVKGYKIGILIDAKFHKKKINVNYVDSVYALADAVGANKSVIVCSNGWTKPAQIKAETIGLELRLITADEAVDFFNPGKWKLCQICKSDYIIMDNAGGLDGLEGFETEGATAWWIMGRCRECDAVSIWCQRCGDEMDIASHKGSTCHCGHKWSVDDRGIYLEMADMPGEIEISN